MPSAISRSIGAALAREAGGRAGTRVSAAIETPNASPLSRKPMKRPTRAMRMPATAGPTMRAALKDTEFKPTALATRPRPTSSMMKDCRVG